MQKSWTNAEIELVRKYNDQKLSRAKISKILKTEHNIERSPDSIKHCIESRLESKSEAKVLLLDIETAPLEALVWGIHEQNVSLKQITKDWSILSWCAKWLGESEVHYMDNRKARNCRNDKKLLIPLRKLLDEADVVVTQNGKAFDIKKINARLILNNLQPVSSFRHFDTYLVARKVFGFTSNKLEYLTDKLCIKYKKQKHAKYAGLDLWIECLNGNIDAWNEMETYNKYDVLSLEELFVRLLPWDKSINFSVFWEGSIHQCSCGSTSFKKHGFVFNNSGKFVRHICNTCGKEYVDKTNLLSKEKLKNMRK